MEEGDRQQPPEEGLDERDRHGYFINVDGFAWQGETTNEVPVDIYRNQANVAQYIYHMALHHGILTKEDRLDELNLLMLGPTYVNLRKQTQEDLKPFWKSKIETEIPDGDLNHMMERIVLNSSRLGNTRFESILSEKASSKYLHVIFFDEAHWGVEDEGQIMRFFKSLLEIIKELKTPPKLFILNVSATARVSPD